MGRLAAAIVFVVLAFAALAGITSGAGQPLTPAHWVIFATFALAGLMAASVFLAMYRTLRGESIRPQR
ncbi:MAG TPA: hypothetical protein VF234_01560 [Limnochordia bacterium]